MSKLSAMFDWLTAVQKAVRFAYQKESEGQQFFEQYRLLSRARTPFAVIGMVGAIGTAVAVTSLLVAPAVLPTLSAVAWFGVCFGGLRAAIKVGSERDRIGKIISDEFRRHGRRTPRNLYDKKSYEAVRELCNLIDRRVEQQLKSDVRSDGLVPDLEKVQAQERRTYTRTPPTIGPAPMQNTSAPSMRKPKP